MLFKDLKKYTTFYNATQIDLLQKTLYSVGEYLFYKLLSY
jgi:hypothetical protein